MTARRELDVAALEEHARGLVDGYLEYVNPKTARDILAISEALPELLRRARECDQLLANVAAALGELGARYARRDTNDESVFCEDCGEASDEWDDVEHDAECSVAVVAAIARIEKGDAP